MCVGGRCACWATAVCVSLNRVGTDTSLYTHTNSSDVTCHIYFTLSNELLYPIYHTGVGSPNATKSSSEKILGSANARIDIRTPIIAGKNIVIDDICLNPNSPSKQRT